MTQHRAIILDGPHQHRILTDIGKPPPALCLLDDNYCYHEYIRVKATRHPLCYRYHTRIGRPKWAFLVAPTPTEATHP